MGIRTSALKSSDETLPSSRAVSGKYFANMAMFFVSVYELKWWKGGIIDTADAGLILGLHPANERRRYKVMRSLIGWVQT